MHNFLPKPSVSFLISILFLLMFSTDVHADLRNGLVGWWKFDEASGNAIDSSGSNNTGTPTGTTVVSNCKRSGCRSFAGGSNYISVSDTNLFSFGDGAVDSPFSAAFWINANNLSANQWLINKRTTASVSEWQFALLATGKMAVDLFSGGVSTVYLDASTNTTIGTNSWHHVVFTYNGNGSTGGFTWYINAVVSSQTTASSGAYVAMSNTAAPVYFATQGFTLGSGSFNGFLDDVRIYNRVLSAQEVKDLYGSGIVMRNAVLRSGHFNQ